MTYEELTKAIVDYFNENEEEFNDVILQADGYDGILGDDRCYPMDEFDDLLCSMKPWDVARACYYGDFRPCDAYFYWNAYGNLESTDNEDYTAYNDAYFAQKLIDGHYANYVDLPDEVQEMIDAYENQDEEEQED